MRPALALCLFWQAFWTPPGGAEHPTADRAGCSASGACYSLHHATIKRAAAQEACNLRGGALSTVRGGAELRAVLELLRAGPGPGGGSKDLLFWVALERGRSNCTLDQEPLRGFSWLSSDVGDSEGDTLRWVEEPQRSCTARKCAGLQATRGVEAAGWKEMRCHLRADGYLCKYQFEGLCPAPRPGAASNLSYRAPFQLHSAALDFSPPGTQVSALCPGQLSVTATCIANRGGWRWDGIAPGTPLCPCPGPYRRAGKCAQLADCLDDSGRFSCECAEGFALGKDGRSCETGGAGRRPTPGGTQMPGPRQPSSTTSPVPKRPESPSVHRELGEMPGAPGQGGSTTSSPKMPRWGAQSTTSVLQVTSQAAKPKATAPSAGRTTPLFNSTSSPAVSQVFDSSTVVFILVAIAIVVLVILTMTVLGLFKLCFHKSPSSQPSKGPPARPGVESGAEETSRRSDSVPGPDQGGKLTRDRADGSWLAEPTPGSNDTKGNRGQ
ncbi:C-type lectin domain family 14 member A [Sorex araneus]|uniref:C-type lectin domain family 14 member A n=1 Tax=Sorex araneus TaxID=42254 RepID=UPI00243345DD|nr:C-type lectin domain family 14 member A [Sorex araneus]